MGLSLSSISSDYPRFIVSDCYCSYFDLHCVRKQSKGIFNAFLGFKHYVIYFECECKKHGKVTVTVEKDEDGRKIRRGFYETYLILEWDHEMSDNMGYLMRKIEDVSVKGYNAVTENCQHYANRVWRACP